MNSARLLILPTLSVLFLSHPAKADPCPAFEAAMTQIEQALSVSSSVSSAWGSESINMPLREPARQEPQPHEVTQYPLQMQFTPAMITVYGDYQDAMPSMISRPVE
jgi:hypothetical protein